MTLTKNLLKRKADDCGIESSPQQIKKQKGKTEIDRHEEDMVMKNKNSDIRKVRFPLLGEYTTDARPPTLVKIEPTEPAKAQAEPKTIGNRPQKLDLFDLAGETRNSIYEYYFANTDPVALTSKNSNLVECQFPLLFAGKKLRGETRAMFYTMKTFLTDDIDITVGFLKALREPQLKALQNITIVDPTKLPTCDAERVLSLARFRRENDPGVQIIAPDEEFEQKDNAQIVTRLLPFQNHEPPRTIRKLRRTLTAIDFVLRRRGLAKGILKMEMLVHTPLDPAHPADHFRLGLGIWKEICRAEVNDYKCIVVQGRHLNMPLSEKDKKIFRPARQEVEKAKAEEAKCKKRKEKAARQDLRIVECSAGK